MHQYKIVNFNNTQANNEILIALLTNLNFDSFEEISDNELHAYVQVELFNEKEMHAMLNELPLLKNLQIEVNDLENRNWNEEWENAFQPIHIGNKCTVRAPFHAASKAQYELVIMPKMAFGTGHHATTEMMLDMMLKSDFKNKEVLDFGCGTGILSLLAEKMGAKIIDANDIEEPAYQNTIENATLNNCSKINALYGDMRIVPHKKYEVILANVTTLTIQENLNQLNALLATNGHIFLSGILVEQKPIVFELAKTFNLKLMEEQELNNWVALHYEKS